MNSHQRDYGDVLPPWPGETLVIPGTASGPGSLHDHRSGAPGRTLHIRHAATTGAGEPAVLVHGLGGSSMNWTDLMGRLQPRCESVAIDLPGFGQSPPPRDGDYSPAGHARAVADLIEARFGSVPVHLFGNSMGGAIGVQLAARRPELVRSLTLVSPALPERRPRRTNVHLPMISIPGVGNRLMRKYLTLDPRRRAQATIDLCFADSGRVPEVRWEEFAEEVARRDGHPYLADAFLGSLRGLMATYLDAGPDRPWQLARRISVPTLLVYGRHDKLVNAKAAHGATSSFPNARVVILHDCGHVAQMEHPDEVASLWLDFVGTPERAERPA